MAENERANRRDSFALFGSHLFLFTAMGYYAFGVLRGLYFPRLSEPIYAGANVALLVLLPALLLFPRLPFGERVFVWLWRETMPIWQRLYDSP